MSNYKAKIKKIIKQYYDLSFIFTFLLVIISIYQISTSKQMLKLENDYDSNLPIYSYIFKQIWENHLIPLSNPLIGHGFPVLGDPLSAFLNPLAFISFLLGGAQIGMKIIVFSSILLSACTMYFVLKKMKYTAFIRTWGALMFAFSGALVSRISAGHLEKILSYPLLPIVFWIIIKEKWSFMHSLLLGFIFSIIFLSGDIYSLYLLIILLIPVKLYFFILNPKEQFLQIRQIIFAVTIFLLLSAIKIVNFIIYVKPHMLRYFYIDPSAGSIPPHYAWLPYIIPFNTMYSEASFLNKLFKLDYNWHEYYVFIGLVPLLLLIVALTKKIKNNIPFLIIILTGFLYVGLNFEISPFYWLNKINPLYDNFRVPSRMLFVMTPALLLLAAGGAAFLLKKARLKYITIFLLFINLIVNIYFFSTIFLSSFEKPKIENKILLQKLKSADKSRFDVAVFTCCYQLFLIENNIRIINYYYGWRMKEGHPNYLTHDAKYFDITQLWGIRPKYLITGRNSQFKTYDYTLFMENKNTYIWIDNKYIKNKNP